MSTEEQFAAVGRIVEDYKQCKTRLAALVSEAGKHADALRGIAARLNPSVPQHSARIDNSNPYSDGKAIDILVERYPTREQVHQTLPDLHAAFERKTELQNRLKEVGLDVRD